MKFFFLVSILAFNVFAQEKQDHQIILLNGGAELLSNQPRYYENIKAMYEAFRSNSLPSNHITVLYGSGQVQDTAQGNEALPVLTPLKPVELKLEPPKLLASTSALGSYKPKTESLFKVEPLPEIKLTSFKAPTEPQRVYSNKELFNGEERELDGEAKKEKIKAKIAELKTKLKPGDDLTLFITDHGDRDEEKQMSEVNLWGEKISTAELGEILKEIPETSQIRIITNICYGGGLTELTSKNICVFSNQESQNPSYSENKDVDLYAQNFAYALKNRLDADYNGTSTYLDAHEYAVSLDNKRNRAKNSLDWFLDKHKDKFQKAKTSADLVCEEPNQNSSSLDELSSTLNSIKKQTHSEITEERKKFLTGRLQQKLTPFINSSPEEKLEELEKKISDVKKTMETAANDWDALPEAEKTNQTEKHNSESEALKKQLTALETEEFHLKKLELELNFIKNADESLISEYENIRKCLEYAY